MTTEHSHKQEIKSPVAEVELQSLELAIKPREEDLLNVAAKTAPDNSSAALDHKVLIESEAKGDSKQAIETETTDPTGVLNESSKSKKNINSSIYPISRAIIRLLQMSIDNALKGKREISEPAPEETLIEQFQLAAHGDMAAQYNMGTYYEWGTHNLDKDEARALYWYRRAAESEHPLALYTIAIFYHEGKAGLEQNDQNDAKAVSFFKKAAEKGDSDAVYMLGKCHELGRGVAKDHKQAVQYYAQSAKLGNSYAECRLGYLYHQGILVPKDDEKAISHLQKWAEKGNVDAQRQLGDIYAENGKDPKQAAMLFQKAAAQGCMRSTNDLGWHHENGLGLPKDEKQAVNCYQTAAKSGNSFSQANMGWCCFYGIGIPKDEHQAAEWFQKAAGQKHAFAQGFCFAHGIGTSQDIAQAFTHYKQAAQDGHQRAQLELALRYHHGRGVTQDLREATVWYYKASIKGFHLAKEHLDKLLAEYPALNEFLATLKLASLGVSGEGEHQVGEKKRTQTAIDASAAKSQDVAALPAGLSLGPLMAGAGLFATSVTSNQQSPGDSKAPAMERKSQM